MPQHHTFLLGAALLLSCAALSCSQEPTQHRALTLEESLSPYTGPSEAGVDTSTLHGKVMCGYQGWFMAAGDGFGAGFVHWDGVDRDPPRCTVDFWPDVSELDEDERFPTNYKHGDGSTARVFSSTVKKTVLRHFEWMRDYGIDGAFVQRFGSCVSNQDDWNYQRSCAVLSHCREGANRYGRTFAVMYDIGFDRRAVDVVKADWTRLINEMRITKSPAYLRHRGAPVVSLWGYGFGHRGFEAEAAEDLLSFLKKPENGGCTIMLGVPNDWASWTDERIELLRQHATIISPWNVGRYGSPEGARGHFETHWPGDLSFCAENDKDYLAVVFPGFSWTNLQKGSSPLNAIPRLGGRFFWSQIEEVRRYGMDMAYVAMFDEVDEGTAIFKCTNNPPVGRFCTYEGLPSDHYLTLTGLAAKLLQGEDVEFPEAQPDPEQMTYRPVPQLEYYKQPSPFSAETTTRWRDWFAGTPLLLHSEPYSDWVADLYNSDALDVQLSTWEAVMGAEELPKVLLLAPGDEGFGGGLDIGRVVSRLQAYLRGGGTLIVAAGGRYPLFYPGGGTEAAKLGFRLRMTQSPRGSTLTFTPEFSADLEPWTFERDGGSRLMSVEVYPDAKSYQSLAPVTLPDGTENGDAIASVQPGGELGEGRIIYVASDLPAYPDREGLLDALLGYVRRVGLP